jgi:hypothetical protein
VNEDLDDGSGGGDREYVAGGGDPGEVVQYVAYLYCVVGETPVSDIGLPAFVGELSLKPDP